MMIAYNICFSTILGKVSVSRNDCDTTERLGTIEYPESLTASAVYQHVRRGWQDPVMVSNGSIFCSKDCRQGLVPKILEEMLALRQMIKRSMKEYKQYPECSVLCRVLEARQLAIKMLSNVTYGYTAAGFSGRMPMAEVADAIVQRGRDTLKWSIREVCTHPSWKAEVHYGDTDSMFVGLSGRTKEAAFRIGEEIVDYITCRYPPAVSILQ
jgi:DNA polymerase zeta